MTGSAPVRVLLADDSPTSRTLMRRLCEDDPRLIVVGEASNGQQAVDRVAELRPSVVVMDIEMPRLDGIEATRQIMSRTPTPILVVTAHYDPDDVALSLRALQAGALSILHKPAGPGSPSFQQDSERFVRMVKALAGVRPVRRYTAATSGDLPPRVRSAGDATATPAATTTTALTATATATPATVRAVGVVASTGGPAALYQLLELLPVPLEVPVLVVQHIASGFAPGLVLWLNAATQLPVRLAEHGTKPQPGTVHVAPDGRHLTVTREGTIALTEDAPAEGFRPSASVLLRSLADAYGAAAVGIVLTGMGSDGLDGARALRQAGAPVLAQDADTSIVFGMPRAVAEAGLATTVGTVPQLARTLAQILKQAR